MVWAVWLSIYHGIFSITIPILLMEIVFPDLKDKSLCNRKSLILVFILFSIAVLITFFLLNPYWPPPLPYFIVILSILLFIGLASRIKDKISLKIQVKKYPFLWGLFITTSFFILFFFAPATPIPPSIPCILGIPIIFLLYSLLPPLEVFKLCSF